MLFNQGFFWLLQSQSKIYITVVFDFSYYLRLNWLGYIAEELCTQEIYDNVHHNISTVDQN